MSETAHERAVAALRLQEWREMLARRDARGRIIKTMCPGLTIRDMLEQHVVDVLTTVAAPSIDETCDRPEMIMGLSA